MKRYRKQGELVKVLWGDAWSSRGWQGPAFTPTKSDHSPLGVTCLGIVRKHNHAGISLAQGVDENALALGHEFIPNGMIRKVTRVK